MIAARMPTKHPRTMGTNTEWVIPDFSNRVWNGSDFRNLDTADSVSGCSSTAAACLFFFMLCRLSMNMYTPTMPSMNTYVILMTKSALPMAWSSLIACTPTIPPAKPPARRYNPILKSTLPTFQCA